MTTCVPQHLTGRLPCCLLLCAASALAGAAETPAPLGIRYQLPADARVSAAIYNARGVQVRTLLSSESQNAGRHDVTWDGLDRDGKPAPAGEYTWRMLSGPGIKAEYLLSLGTSVGHDHWPCQHGGPAAVAVDSDGFIMGGSSEGSPTLSKATFDGTVVWHRSGFPAPEGLVDVAADGTRLYALLSSTALERLDVKTGATVHKANNQGAYRFKLWQLIKSLGKVELNNDQDKDAKATRELTFDVPNGHYLLRFKARMTPESAGAVLHCTINDRWFSFKDCGLKAGGTVDVCAPLVYGNHQPVSVNNGKLTLRFHFENSPPDGKWGMDDIELLAPATRVAAQGGALAVLFPSAGLAAWVDPENGALLARAAVPGARDIALCGANDLVAAAGDRILRARRSEGKGEAVVETVAEGLADAERICCTADGKRAFVFCGGKKQQVVALDASLKPAAAFGREGGRKAGLYHAEDFLAVSDIAAEPAGGFLITEWMSAPRRTAWFDAEGKLRKEWFGGQQFYTFAAPEPDNPNLVWMDSQWGWLMQVEVDYAARTWKPRACYSWNAHLNGQFFPTGKMAGHHFPFRMTLSGKPTTCIWLQGSGLVLRVDEEAGQMLPVAYLGRMFPNTWWNWNDVPFEQYPKPFVDALTTLKVDARNKSQAGLHLGYAWADADGDGKVQAEEIRILPPKLYGGGHGFHSGAQVGWLDAATLSQYVSGGKAQTAYRIRKPVGQTPSGAPIWDWAGDYSGAALADGGASPSSSGESRSMRLDAAGNVYVLMGGGGDGFNAGLESFHSHGIGWPGTLTDRTGVARYNAKGELQWAAGSKTASGQSPRGKVNNPVLVVGFAKGFVGVADYFIVPCHFWTDDGLYAGTLLDGRADDGLPARVYKWWRADTSRGDEYDNLAAFQYDMLAGGSLIELPNGEVVYIGAGWNNCPVYRVHGLDRFERQTGTLTVTAPLPAASGKGTGLLAEYRGLVGGKSSASENLEDASEMRLDTAEKGPPGSALKQTDAQIWFGDTKHAWPRHLVTRGAFSVRWSGQLEPEFSDDYLLGLYLRGKARLWLGGVKLLDCWSRDQENQKHFTAPVRLEAGRRYNIVIEYSTGKVSKPEAHLVWESSAQGIEHVAASALYPEMPQAPGIRMEPAELSAAKGGAPVTVSFVRNGPLDKPVTVRYSVSGNARQNEHVGNLDGQAVFAAGSARTAVSVAPLDNGKAEPLRTLEMRLAPSWEYQADAAAHRVTVFVNDRRAVPIRGVRIHHAASPQAMKSAATLVDEAGLDQTQPIPNVGDDGKGAWLQGGGNAGAEFLVFDLGSLHELPALRIWNYNVAGTEKNGAPKTNHGVQEFELLTGAEPDKLTPCGKFQLPEAPGQPGYRGHLIELPSGVKARYVKLQIKRSHTQHGAPGVPGVGLSRIVFHGCPATSP